jgi:hypothetical protein
LQRQLAKDFGVGSQGKGAGLVGSREPDIVEFYLDRGEIIITDITLNVESAVHVFKSRFYQEVMQEIVGPDGPRVHALDIDPSHPGVVPRVHVHGSEE